MKISYNWINEYIKGKLLKPEKLADLLTLHSFETEVLDNNILDIDILPNRAHDCLSHIGVAKEIAALTNSKFKIQNSKLTESRNSRVEDFVRVEIKDTELCPRYTARVISDVKVGSSPKWLRERLEAVGQQSINNIVDATNYVMFETGQPLHAFDFDKLAAEQRGSKRGLTQKKIIVRRAKKGEKITTLDGEKCELDNDILVIADSKDPLAIAGIKGGKKAEIDSNTKTIVLESANFDLHNIHKTSRKIRIQTESSLRFEHGLDPNLASEAIDRLAGLIQEIAGKKVAKGMIDIYPNKIMPSKIALTLTKINSVLGIDISLKEVIRILTSLGFEVRTSSAAERIVRRARSLIGKPYKLGAELKHAPHAFNCSSLVRYVYRQMGFSLPRDSIEQIEVGKRISKKHLQPGDLIFSKGSAVPRRNKKWPKGVGHVGIYVGDEKVIHASSKAKQVEETALEEFSDWRGACRILEEKDCLLSVKVPTRRLDIRLPEDLIEEVGRIYGYQKIISKPPVGMLVSASPDDSLKLKRKIKNILEGFGLTEVYNYSFVGKKDLEKIKGDSRDYIELKNPLSSDLQYLRRNLITNLLKNAKENFKYFDKIRLFELGKIYLKNERMMLTGILGRKTNKDSLFYEVKGIVDGLLDKLGISDYWYDDFQASPEWSSRVFWQPGRSAEIKVDNKEIGYLGEINFEILSKFAIKGWVAAFNIDFGSLIELAEEELIYAHPSKYPAVVRDVAVLVNLGDRVVDVLNIINSAGGALVRDVDLFDMYEGRELPEGKKNLAFHIIYQSDQKTLSDKEVDKIHKKIINALEKERGWNVRK